MAMMTEARLTTRTRRAARAAHRAAYATNGIDLVDGPSLSDAVSPTAVSPTAVRAVLRNAGVREVANDVTYFIDDARARAAIRGRWIALLREPRRLNPGDILRLALDARDAGDVDEAIWRAFLAAYTGRTSASTPEEDAAAGRLLYGFWTRPRWTWARVSARPDIVEAWLHDRAAKLATLSFGARRRHEPTGPAVVYTALLGFVVWVETRGEGSPAAAFGGADPAADPAARFAALYRTMDIPRLGPAAALDLLTLIGDLGILPIAPDSCHVGAIAAARQGATRLLDARDTAALARACDALACAFDVPFPSMLDALVVYGGRRRWPSSWRARRTDGDR